MLQTIADNCVQICLATCASDNCGQLGPKCLADAGRRMSENLNNERSPNTIWSSRGADKFGQECPKLSGSTCCQTYLDNFVRNCLAPMLPDTFGQLCPQLSGIHAARHILTQLSAIVWRTCRRTHLDKYVRKCLAGRLPNISGQLRLKGLVCSVLRL